MNRRTFLKHIGMAGGGLLFPSSGRAQEIIPTCPEDLSTIIPENFPWEELNASRRWTEEGMFLRTYRWDIPISTAEEQYEIPPGLLAGLAMRESNGDPLRLNSGSERCPDGDGGAGLFMFQPGTAEQLGLVVYGTSARAGADCQNGRELRELVTSSASDYATLAQLDQRFDVCAASEAAGRYLRYLYERFAEGELSAGQNWNRALSAYNRGRPAEDPEATEHVQAVRQYQDYYLERRAERVPCSPVSEHFLPIEETEQGCVFSYVVQPGDSAARISSCFNTAGANVFQPVSSQSIVDEERQLPLGNLIYPGQVVLIHAVAP